MNDLLNSCRFIDLFIARKFNVTCPTNRLVRNSEAGENFIIEVVGAQENFMYFLQEITRLGTLNYTVIISASESHNFANCHASQGFLTGTLKFGGIVHCTDSQNHSLPND